MKPHGGGFDLRFTLACERVTVTLTTAFLGVPRKEKAKPATDASSRTAPTNGIRRLGVAQSADQTSRAHVVARQTRHAQYRCEFDSGRVRRATLSDADCSSRMQ